VEKRIRTKSTVFDLTHQLRRLKEVWGSLKDHSSERIRFLDLLAGHKGNGRVPKASEEIAV
jgi:hypothetical protein